MFKMIIGLLFAIGMLVETITNKAKVKPFTFYLKTVIVVFAIVIIIGQLFGGQL